MPKQTAYKNLEVYHLSKKLVIACYELTHDLPEEEKTNFTRYIRTAALNLHINIAQAVFQKPKKRKKFIQEGKNSLVIIDAAAGILVDVGFVSQEDVDLLNSLANACEQGLDQL